MIKLLVTDLDDTLYSWIGFFIPAFYGMVGELSRILGKGRNCIIQEYKVVHQEKGSVEYPYATLLLPSVKEAFPNYTRQQIVDVLDPAFHKFNSIRKNKLCLFPGVKETLEELSSTGIIIVGYTESAEENGYYRLSKLGIDHLFRRVYVSNSQYDRPGYIPSSDKTQVVHGKKPNPALLLQILQDENVGLTEAIYIGDSLTKDIYMAKEAGILSIICKYPTKSNAEDLYSQLVAITNWTECDFKYESELRNECKLKNIKPDYTIESFYEVKDIIEGLNRR